MTPEPRPPELQFRLAGGWWSIDLADEAASRRCVDRILAAAPGTHDLGAGARRLLRRGLLAAAERARSGGAAMLAVMARHLSGAAMPVVLTVQRPSVRVAAATGDAGIAEALARALRAGDHPAAQTLVRRRGPGGPVLRTHRMLEGAGVATRQLVAEYFVPVPGTRTFALVTLSTSLADIPNLMLRQFDAIVEVAQFAPVVRG